MVIVKCSALLAANMNPRFHACMRASAVFTTAKHGKKASGRVSERVDEYTGKGRVLVEVVMMLYACQC